MPSKKIIRRNKKFSNRKQKMSRKNKKNNRSKKKNRMNKIKILKGGTKDGTYALKHIRRLLEEREEKSKDDYIKFLNKLRSKEHFTLTEDDHDKVLAKFKCSRGIGEGCNQANQDHLKKLVNTFFFDKEILRVITWDGQDIEVEDQIKFLKIAALEKEGILYIDHLENNYVFTMSFGCYGGEKLTHSRVPCEFKLSRNVVILPPASIYRFKISDALLEEINDGFCPIYCKFYRLIAELFGDKKYFKPGETHIIKGQTPIAVQPQFNNEELIKDLKFRFETQKGPEIVDLEDTEEEYAL